MNPRNDQPAATAPPRQVTREYRCECGCSILGVSFYAPFKDDPAEWFIEVYKLPGSGWRWRLRNALNLILGREVVIDAVSMDEPKAREFVEWMARHVREVGAEPLRVPTSSDHVDLTARPS
jgi:hypothetical protein